MAMLLDDLCQAADFGVVDAHHHLWNLAGGSYPWLQHAYRGDTFMGDYSRLCQSYQADDYRADTAGVCIAATVHVEAERARDEALAESQWLNQVARENTGIASAIVPWVDLWADDVAERIDAHVLANGRVRGIRCKPRVAPGPTEPCPAGPGCLDDPHLSAGLAALLTKDLAWDLRVPWWHLMEAAERLTDFPQLTVVLNHAGLPWDRSESGMRNWRRGMAVLARLPRVFVKLSELSAPGIGWDESGVRRVVETTLDLFGPGRCMFATNLPVAKLTVDVPTMVRVIAEAVAPLGEVAMRAVFMTTASTAYRFEVERNSAGGDAMN